MERSRVTPTVHILVTQIKDPVKFDDAVTTLAETGVQSVCDSMLARPISRSEIYSRTVQARMFIASYLSNNEVFLKCENIQKTPFEPQLAASLDDLVLHIDTVERSVTFKFTYFSHERAAKSNYALVVKRAEEKVE